VRRHELRGAPGDDGAAEGVSRLPAPPPLDCHSRLGDAAAAPGLAILSIANGRRSRRVRSDSTRQRFAARTSNLLRWQDSPTIWFSTSHILKHLRQSLRKYAIIASRQSSRAAYSRQSGCVGGAEFWMCRGSAGRRLAGCQPAAGVAKIEMLMSYLRSPTAHSQRHPGRVEIWPTPPTTRFSAFALAACRT